MKTLSELSLRALPKEQLLFIETGAMLHNQFWASKAPCDMPKFHETHRRSEKSSFFLIPRRNVGPVRSKRSLRTVLQHAEDLKRPEAERSLDDLGMPT